MSPIFSRRAAIAGGFAASAAVVAPIALAADRKLHAMPQTAQQRYDFHLAGLKAAASELDPTITTWGIAPAQWGFGARFLLVGTGDENLSWGESLGGFLPIEHFTHKRAGVVPTYTMPNWRTPDERYAAMTDRENFYRHWLGMEVLS